MMRSSSKTEDKEEKINKRESQTFNANFSWNPIQRNEMKSGCFEAADKEISRGAIAVIHRRVPTH